jgi:AcrR family transcriptional regulator
MPSAMRKLRVGLSRERIEDAASALIERDGLDAFSTRKLAAELSCEAMSIYYHFPSKAHLLEALVDRALKALMPLPPEELGAIERLRRVAWQVRDLALAQPNLLLHLVVHRLDGKVGLTFYDQLAAIFLAAAPDAEMAARLFATYGFFLRGAVAVAANAKAIGAGAVEPPDPQRVPQDFPSFSSLMPHFGGRDFEIGLELMLAGFAEQFRR